MKNIAIQLTGVSKQYTIHHEKPTLVEKFYKGRDEKFWALKNINLTIKKGERVGIIGPNGSGKTTLLKIIAGITTPTSGKTFTSGKIVSLIDLEAGFHPDLSGYQNIFLNGMLLGMTKQEIANKLHAIIQFADIRQFIDIPLYTYSSGMMVRLGFAVAISTNPDILIIDEGLSIGDQNFQMKADKYIKTMHLTHKTLISVSHDLSKILSYCNRVIWLNKGTSKMDEKANMVINKYARPLYIKINPYKLRLHNHK